MFMWIDTDGSVKYTQGWDTWTRRGAERICKQMLNRPSVIHGKYVVLRIVRP